MYKTARAIRIMHWHFVKLNEKETDADDVFEEDDGTAFTEDTYVVESEDIPCSQPRSLEAAPLATIAEPLATPTLPAAA